jgi:putative PIN family toxin of toxin-antitoxin system
MTRVVLDTNVVLSALVFTSGRLADLRRAWQHRALQPLACKETTRELLRVLSYPKFNLTPGEQQDLLGAFLEYAEVVPLPEPWPELPACRDAKDKMFLVLSRVGGAEALITGDQDLLAMREAFPGLIFTPEEWLARGS